MIKFMGYQVPPEFVSDGCTRAKDSWFGVSIKPACIYHDFMRRHRIVPRVAADLLAFLFIIRIRWWLLPVAFVYLLGMLATSFWYYLDGVQPVPLPPEWKQYGKRQ